MIPMQFEKNTKVSLELYVLCWSDNVNEYLQNVGGQRE
jgi:hypothetical protein